MADNLYCNYLDFSKSNLTTNILGVDWGLFPHFLLYWLDSIQFIFGILFAYGMYTYLACSAYSILQKKISQNYAVTIPNVVIFFILLVSHLFLYLLLMYTYNMRSPSLYLYYFSSDFVYYISAIFFIIYVLLTLIYIRYKFKQVIFMVLIFSGLCFYPYLFSIVKNQANTYKEKDIIIVHLDALRPDYLQTFGAPFTSMPYFENLLKDKGAYYNDATTAFARSFSSAMSTLSSSYPTTHGIRDNGYAKHNIKTNLALSHELQKLNYQTVLSGDGLQWTYIDKDYGFDKIWSPGMGAITLSPASFGGNLPLVALLTNSRLGELLFPYNYADRNYDKLYKGESYLSKINRELHKLDTNKPLFYYAILAYAHTPFIDDTENTLQNLAKAPNNFKDACSYALSSMEALDQQFKEFLELLKSHGRLENTILVVYSDHGNGFLMNKDRILGDGGELEFAEGYYGNNGIAKSSQNVLISFFEFGKDSAIKPGLRATPVSTIDIMPTIFEMAGLKYPRKLEGISLLKNLYSKDGNEITPRLRYLESGRVMDFSDRKVAIKVINTAAKDMFIDLNDLYFTSGDHYNEYVLKSKERSVVLGDWALYLQNIKSEPVLVNRKDNVWFALEDSPSDVNVEFMLQGLCSHWHDDVEKLFTEKDRYLLAGGSCQANEQKKLLAKILNNPIYSLIYEKNKEEWLNLPQSPDIKNRQKTLCRRTLL